MRHAASRKGMPAFYTEPDEENYHMKNRSLTFKLITGGFLAVFIPIAIIGLFSVSKASNALKSLTEEKVRNQAVDLADAIQLVALEPVKQIKQLSES
jgi:hypothetical protein